MTVGSLNKPVHISSAAVAVLLVVIGLTEPLHLPGPRFLPPSWQVIYMILPNGLDWTYTTLWALAGFASLAGVRWVCWLRLGFRMSAFLFLSWGLAGIPAIWLGLGGNIQGSAANLICAIFAWNSAHGVSVAEHGDAVNVQIERLADQVEDATADDTTSFAG